MNVNQLEYFIETVQCRSLNKAAQNLFISQPALKKAVDILENELGFPLLNRSWQGVSVTDAGEKVYEDSLKILHIIRGWDKFRTPSETSTYTDIYIAATPSAFSTVINNIVSEFSKSNNYVTIIPLETNYADLTKILSPNNIRFGIMFSQAGEDLIPLERAAKMGLEKKYIYSDSYCLYTSRKHKLAQYSTIHIQDLINYPVIISPQSVYPSNPFFQLFTRRSNIVAGNYSLYFNLTIANNALLLAPKLVAESNYFTLTGQGKIITITGVSPELTQLNYYLYYPPIRELSKSEKLLIEFIIAYCKTLNTAS